MLKYYFITRFKQYISPKKVFYRNCLLRYYHYSSANNVLVSQWNKPFDCIIVNFFQFYHLAFFVEFSVSFPLKNLSTFLLHLDLYQQKIISISVMRQSNDRNISAQLLTVQHKSRQKGSFAILYLVLLSHSLTNDNGFYMFS